MSTGILKILRTTTAKIGVGEDHIRDERWNAGSYGTIDQRTRDAIKLLARTKGSLTDPVYTGKALAGLIGRAGLGEVFAGENVLFVHTGGVQVLSAYIS